MRRISKYRVTFVAISFIIFLFYVNIFFLKENGYQTETSLVKKCLETWGMKHKGFFLFIKKLLSYFLDFESSLNNNKDDCPKEPPKDMVSKFTQGNLIGNNFFNFFNFNNFE